MKQNWFFPNPQTTESHKLARTASLNLTAFVVALLFALPARGVSTSAASLPAGTVLYIRLTTPVSTATSKVHATVTARVVREVLAGNSVVIPLGTVLEGDIEKIAKSTDPDTPALLLLKFSKLELPQEKPVAISCHLSQVENARESVLADGSILGVKSSQMGSTYVNDALGKLEQSLPGLSSTIQGVQKKQVGAPAVDIVFPAGTDMQVALDQALPVEKTYAAAVPETLPGNLATAVHALLTGVPQRSETADGKPGDPLNLVIIGSQQQITNAFAQAGWIIPRPKQNQSILKTVQAVIQDQGYGAAPISNLYLFARPQDLAFEKVLDTFNMRHHLRLWRSTAKTPDGREIWIGAAVHDTGIDIHPGVVSHATDPNLDEERAKVGADLLDTSLVSAEALIIPPQPLTQGLTGTGGAWHTDGKLLVINLRTN
ncbi:MAG TPA: LssY C-terminal domain-containing protein [Terriglobia bacterium]|nr:LssY C-terminal domain-containing protein [Terriglobia bacterium]